MLPRRSTYASSIFEPDFLVARRIRNFVHEEIGLRVRKGLTVLDAGCGEQPFRVQFESNGASYIGLDLSQNKSATVDLIAPLTQIPLGHQSVDVVLFTEVLEHVSETEKAFSEIARVLRPNGVCLITTPFAYPLHEEPHDYLRMTPSGLRACAARHGLRVDRLEAAGNEIEAIAIAWNNLWARMPLQWPFALRVAFAAIRLPFNAACNLLAIGIASLMGRLLPRKLFQTTVCVLTRLE